MCRVLCDTLTARLARFPIKLPTTRFPMDLWTFRRSETICACGWGLRMSQKYRQHGYNDRDRDRGRDETRPKPSADKPVKKKLSDRALCKMPGTHTVSRCAQCGTLLTSIVEPVGQCPKCGFELHSCRQCTYFDTSSRFECTQPIPERIPRKDERNPCTFFSTASPRRKETSTPSLSQAHGCLNRLRESFQEVSPCVDRIYRPHLSRHPEAAESSRRPRIPGTKDLCTRLTHSKHPL